MELIKSIEELQSLISYIKLQNKGFITNFFISHNKQCMYIEDTILYYKKCKSTVFIFLHLHDYFKLYYFACSYNDLSESLAECDMPESIIICELIGKSAMSDEKNILADNGFSKYSKLIHFTKKMNNSNREIKFPNCIRYGTNDDFPAIKSIMYAQFNKYVDINLTDNEILHYINNQSCVVVVDNNIVIGFSIYDIQTKRMHAIIGGLKSEYKDSFFGVILFDFLIKLHGTANIVSAFVREDNEYLLNWYRKLDYKEDGLYSEIFYKENGNEKIDKIIPMN